MTAALLVTVIHSSQVRGLTPILYEKVLGCLVNEYFTSVLRTNFLAFSRFIELNNKVFAIYGVFLPFLVMSCEINNRKYVSPVDSIPILLRLFRYKYIEPKAMLCLHLYHQFRILESMIHCLGRWTNKVRVRLEVSQ